MSGNTKSLRMLALDVRFEQDVVLARRRAREMAAAMGFELSHQTSIATSVSEIARNAFQYAGGGRVEYAVVTETNGGSPRPRQSLVITVSDRGPGIARLAEILDGRYQSASGLGLGVIGSKRLMDRADFASSPQGTVATLVKHLPPIAAPKTPAQLQAIVDEMISRPAADPLEELQSQNRELLRTMDAMRQREEELARVNQELAETNTGVLALYDEIDTLHRITVTLASKLELQPLIQTMISVTTALTSAEIGAFYSREENHGPWKVYGTSGQRAGVLDELPSTLPPEFFGPDLAEAGLVCIRDAAAQNWSGPGTEFVRLIAEKFAVRSFITVPVVSPDQVLLGVMVFASERPELFSERSERILTSVATQAVVGIEKARLFQSVTAASEAKDQFVAMLSHELRTPLSPVLAIVSSLQGDPRVPSTLAEELEVVLRNIRLEARLIDDLLDFNRLINGKLTIAREPLDLHSILNAVVEICREDLEAKGHRLSAGLYAPRADVVGDSARLQQVLWNVLKNAIKFTPFAGEISIRTSITGDMLRIEIADSGRGIEPGELEHIFRAFDQGSAKANRQFGGLGLGLSIARMFLSLHGGAISASSAGLGKGARFSIDLPLGPTTHLAPASHQPTPAASACTGRILLIEDHADTLRTMERLLSRCGYEVVTAASATQARERLSGPRFDLVISDLGLPDCSGLDLMREIRLLHSMPAIALSGYGMEADLTNSTQAGFSAHLVKPIEIADLCRLAAKLLLESGTQGG